MYADALVVSIAGAAERRAVGAAKTCAVGAVLEVPRCAVVASRDEAISAHYTLCWAPFELYHPKSAEQLAALRVTRERKKDEQFAEEYPLFSQMGLTRKDAQR